MKQKIDLRLALIALIAILTTTFGITWVYYGLFHDRVRNDLKTNAQLLADTGFFQKLYEEAGHDPARLDQPALESIRSDELRITWIDANGTVLYDNDTSAAAMENHLDRPEIVQALENGSGESTRRSDTLNTNTFYYALRLNDDTVLRISTQARSGISMILTSVPVILAVLAAVLLLCVLIGHLLTIQLIRPIDRMAEDLDHIDEVEYPELEPFARRIRSQHDHILESAKIRQDFTANISHELKTPLTAISGYAELIEEHMIDASQETHIAQSIRKNADRLLALINDSILLTELDHRELPRKFTAINLYKLAEECCRGLAVSAEKRSIVLTCQGTDTMVTGDRDLLKELLENLIQNSIRYDREHGWVRVKVTSEEGHAVVSVSDNGIGIPADQQERVFERFYRVDKSRSRETGGTGLGLSIVKHIAELHSATIQLTSELEKGTRVTVRF